MSMIQEDFKIKYYKVAETDIYLGSNISKMPLEGGKACCKMSD